MFIALKLYRRCSVWFMRDLYVYFFFYVYAISFDTKTVMTAVISGTRVSISPTVVARPNNALCPKIRLGIDREIF